MKTAAPNYVQRYGIALLILVPLVVIGILVWLEQVVVWQSPTIVESTGGALSEGGKKSLELTVDLAHTFITLASTLIGAVAYYIKTRSEFRPFSRFAITAAVGSLTCAAFSVFFGHIWLEELRNELARDHPVNPSSGIFVLPERLQYIAFVIALSWFALLVLEREPERTPDSKTESP